MTLVESTSEQLIKDFATFVASPEQTKFFAARSVIVHLNKMKKFYEIHSLNTDLIKQQTEYITKNYLQ